MKLRYYLRGLAVGMILTTVILTIANAGNRPLTDAQIRQRAQELGMVDGESSKLSSLQADFSSGTETQTGSKTETQTETGKESVPEPETGSKTETQTETGKESVPEPGSSLPSQSRPAEETAGTISFQIKSGANSYTVSKDLAALGLVEDAAAFDTYLCDKGYSRRIRVGTYEIPVGASEEEIAEIIAR